MSDEQIPQPVKDYTLRQRLVAYGVIFVLPPLLIYFAARTVLIVWPLQSGWMLGFQGLALVIAALMLALAVYLIVVPVRRKIQTGKFLLGRGEAAKRARESLEKFGAGKPLRPQIWFVLLPLLLSFILLWLGGIAISLGWCGCAPTKFRDIVVMALGGVLVCGGLAYPFIVIRRKLRTGNFLPSQEEIAKRRAKCGKPQPMGWRTAAAAMWLFIAVFGTYSAIAHMHRPHAGTFSPWFAAVMAWLAAAIWTRQVFCPRSPQCALPLDEPNPSS